MCIFAPVFELEEPCPCANFVRYLPKHHFEWADSFFSPHTRIPQLTVTMVIRQQTGAADLTVAGLDGGGALDIAIDYHVW